MVAAADLPSDEELDKLARAAIIIERQGVSGLSEAKLLCGKMAAFALLLAKCQRTLTRRDDPRISESWNMASNMIRGANGSE